MQRTLVVLLLGAVLSTAAELEPMSSAERCGACHREILAAWKSSAHAKAMESRLFQDALTLVEDDFGEATTRTCLTCHSPLGTELEDYSLRQKVSWEGVTCDYCHSMRSVSMSGANPTARLEYSLTKSGPIEGATPLAHGVVFSEVHTTSQVCAPCHEYKNSEGLQVLSTYSEWQESRYAEENIQCQSCHMGNVEGNVVDPSVVSSDAILNRHQMPGGHSMEQLNRAIRFGMNTKRDESKVTVSITIENAGAGHYVPTGSPMRRMELELRADAYRGEDLSETRTYSRVVADASGATIDFEHRAFVKGAKVVSDTRLAPDEKRTETFELPVASGIPVQVVAELYYYYSPMATSDSEERVRFRELRRIVR